MRTRLEDADRVGDLHVARAGCSASGLGFVRSWYLMSTATIAAASRRRGRARTPRRSAQAVEVRGIEPARRVGEPDVADRARRVGPPGVDGAVGAREVGRQVAEQVEGERLRRQQVGPQPLVVEALVRARRGRAGARRGQRAGGHEVRARLASVVERQAAPDRPHRLPSGRGRSAACRSGVRAPRATAPGGSAADGGTPSSPAAPARGRRPPSSARPRAPGARGSWSIGARGRQLRPSRGPLLELPKPLRGRRSRLGRVGDERQPGVGGEIETLEVEGQVADEWMAEPLVPARWNRTSWPAHRIRNSSLRVESTPTRSVRARS